MKSLILSALVFLLIQKNIFQVVLSGIDQENLFLSYQNLNFRQVVIAQGDELQLEIERYDFDWFLLENPLLVNQNALQNAPLSLQNLFRTLVAGEKTERGFFRKVLTFLKEQISYAQDDQPQDLLSVLERKTASCVGYCNLTAALLELINIKARGVSGFYLENSSAEPEAIPHRWLEIELRNSKKFFFDPQTQDFSFTYLLLNQIYKTEEVKKFRIIKVQIKRKVFA